MSRSWAEDTHGANGAGRQEGAGATRFSALQGSRSTWTSTDGKWDPTAAHGLSRSCQEEVKFNTSQIALISYLRMQSHSLGQKRDLAVAPRPSGHHERLPPQRRAIVSCPVPMLDDILAEEVFVCHVVAEIWFVLAEN